VQDCVVLVVVAVEDTGELLTKLTCAVSPTTRPTGGRLVDDVREPPMGRMLTCPNAEIAANNKQQMPRFNIY
jgi:hypothetical protein